MASKPFTRHLLAPILCALLLGGVMGVSAMRRSPADTAAYHQAARRAIGQIPRVIGDWVGQDAPVPASAIKLLKPNALLSRRYTNTKTGQVATLLLVQTVDARSLVGHYPPVCYPSQGWRLTDTKTDPFQDQRVTRRRRVYTFTRGELTQTHQLEVQNLMVLPIDQTATTMGAVNAVANRYTVRYYGAGEIQLVTDHPLPPRQRDALWHTFYEACRPAIEHVLHGAADPASKPHPAQPSPTP